MAAIPIEQAQVGMKLNKDIFAGKGIKLAARGVVLTANQIQVLIKNNIRIIDIQTHADSDEELMDAPPAPVLNREKLILLELLQTIPLFEKLSAEHMELLVDRFKIQNHDAGTVLFHEGDPGDSFFVVLKGAIKIYIRNNRGKEKILSICHVGDSFGELSLLDGKPRSASAQSLQKTQLLVISQQDFMTLLHNHFEITQRIFKELIGRIFETQQHFTDLTNFDARTRVIKNLIKLASRFGRRTPKAIEVDLPLDLNELAQMVGVELWELHDVLTELEKIEFIRISANYYALNMEKFSELN